MRNSSLVAAMSGLCLLCGAAMGCGEADGPLSWTLGLVPAPAAKLLPGQFDESAGRLSAEIQTGRLSLAIEGLPVAGPPLELWLGFGAGLVRPQSLRPADVEVPVLEERRVLSLEVDGQGRTQQSLADDGLPLGRVVRATVRMGALDVLEGEIGNLDEEATPPVQGETSGGHHH